MLDFPANPGLGDVFSYWTWDGEKWVTAASTGNFLPIIGGIVTGNLGVQGSTTLASLLVQGASTFQGNATVHGTLSAINNAVVGGDILVNGNQRTLGNAEIVGDLDLTGDADFGRNLTVAMDADIGGDLDVAGSANIAQNLTVGGDADITGTLNALGNVNVTGILTLTSDPTSNLQAATKRYVDEAIAAQMLWQGTWDAATNVPDLTDTALQVNGYTWSITTPDPTQPYTIPATPVIPGLSGVTVYNGDHVVWSDVANAFQITQGSSLSLQEAQDMFVELAGDTMTGPLTISGAHNLTVGQDIIGQRDLTLTRDLTAGRNLAITGTSALHGNTTIGTAGTAANLQVTGTSDLDGYVTVRDQMHTESDVWLATDGGNVTVGDSGNTGAALRVYGATDLATDDGAVTVGSTTYTDATLQSGLGRIWGIETPTAVPPNVEVQAFGDAALGTRIYVPPGPSPPASAVYPFALNAPFAPNPTVFGAAAFINGHHQIMQRYRIGGQGTVGRRTVILLHGWYDPGDAFMPRGGVQGTLQMHRGGASAFNRFSAIELHTHTAYATNNYWGRQLWETEQGSFVRCVYNGRKYLAIDVPYQRGQLDNIWFDGITYTQSGYESLKKIDWWNVDTDSVIAGSPASQEIADSIEYLSPITALTNYERIPFTPAVGIGASGWAVFSFNRQLLQVQITLGGLQVDAAHDNGGIIGSLVMPPGYVFSQNVYTPIFTEWRGPTRWGPAAIGLETGGNIHLYELDPTVPTGAVSPRGMQFLYGNAILNPWRW